MPRSSSPRIRELRPAECLALLRQQAVGRMAFSLHDRVDLLPIHYVYSDGWLFARTSHGRKMITLAHSPWVAFEVDEVRGIFDWKSVVVHGTVYRMESGGASIEAALWEKGIAALKDLIPGTGTYADPVAYRSVVFGIHINDMSGRVSHSGSAGGRPRGAGGSTDRTPRLPPYDGT